MLNLANKPSKERCLKITLDGCVSSCESQLIGGRGRQIAVRRRLAWYVYIAIFQASQSYVRGPSP